MLRIIQYTNVNTIWGKPWTCRTSWTETGFLNWAYTFTYFLSGSYTNDFNGWFID